MQNLSQSTHNLEENLKILHTATNGLKLHLLESFEINGLKTGNLLLNDKLELKSF